jgi:hypothetical protein
MSAPGPVEQASIRLPAVVRWVLRAYPGWWRERYGADQEMFLEDLSAEGRRLAGALFDLARGAALVRLRPAGMPESVGAWRDRTRASIAWATVPALAGVLLANVITQHSFRNSTWAGPASSMSAGGRVAADSMSAVSLAGASLVFFLLIG